ncbi:MAG: hypothetical protein HYV47_01545 [Candidatus Nealsonbacteria bacterium]|nr:hypothetical protein [Candidatus Nealsonbacteria bacterium]
MKGERMNNSELLRVVTERTRSGKLQWLQRKNTWWCDVRHAEFECYGLSLIYYPTSTPSDLCLRIENYQKYIELRDRGFRFFSKPIHKLYDLIRYKNLIPPQTLNPHSKDRPQDLNVWEPVNIPKTAKEKIEIINPWEKKVAEIN